MIYTRFIVQPAQASRLQVYGSFEQEASDSLAALVQCVCSTIAGAPFCMQVYAQGIESKAFGFLDFRGWLHWVDLLRHGELGA